MYPFPLFGYYAILFLFVYYITVFLKRKAKLGAFYTFSIFSKNRRFSRRGIVFVTEISAAFPLFLNTLIFYQTFLGFAMRHTCFSAKKVIFFSRIFAE